jgi:hypothetical protein
LWLHITASLGLICRSQGSEWAFRLWHERTVFKDQPGLQDLLRDSYVLFLLPNIEHAMFMSKS